MYIVYGDVYTFTFTPELITIKSPIHGLKDIEIVANHDEDFSIFDLGPHIAEDVEMLAASVKIGVSRRNNVYLHVWQAAGNYIKIEIKTQPSDPRTQPIDSGDRLEYIKDYVRTYG